MNAVRVEWHEIVAKAHEQGHAKELPRPQGLREDGHYNLNKTAWKDGRVKRTLYYGVTGEMTTIGWWVEAAQGRETPEQQVNGTGKGKAARSGDRPKQTPPPTGPAPELEPVVSVVSAARPMILVEPGPEGTRFHAYGLELPEVIEELRRCLVHLVATSAGMEVISAVVPRDAAVVTGGGTIAAIVPVHQGKRKAGGRVKRTVSYPKGLDWSELDEEEDGPDQGELLRQDAW